MDTDLITPAATEAAVPESPAPPLAYLSDLIAAGAAHPDFHNDRYSFIDGWVDEGYEGCAMGAALVGAYPTTAEAFRAYVAAGADGLATIVAAIQKVATVPSLSDPQATLTLPRHKQYGTHNGLAGWVSGMHYSSNLTTAEIVTTLREAGL